MTIVQIGYSARLAIVASLASYALEQKKRKEQEQEADRILERQRRQAKRHSDRIDRIDVARGVPLGPKKKMKKKKVKKVKVKKVKKVKTVKKEKARGVDIDCNNNHKSPRLASVNKDKTCVEMNVEMKEDKKQAVKRGRGRPRKTCPPLAPKGNGSDIGCGAMVESPSTMIGSVEKDDTSVETDVDKKELAVKGPLMVPDNVPQKRGRGRPRKTCPPLAPKGNESDIGCGAMVISPSTMIDSVEKDNTSVETDVDKKELAVKGPLMVPDNVPQKRGRGRPRKTCPPLAPKGNESDIGCGTMVISPSTMIDSVEKDNTSVETNVENKDKEKAAKGAEKVSKPIVKPRGRPKKSSSAPAPKIEKSKEPERQLTEEAKKKLEPVEKKYKGHMTGCSRDDKSTSEKKHEIILNEGIECLFKKEVNPSQLKSREDKTSGTKRRKVENASVVYDVALDEKTSEELWSIIDERLSKMNGRKPTLEQLKNIVSCVNETYKDVDEDDKNLAYQNNKKEKCYGEFRAEPIIATLLLHFENPTEETQMMELGCSHGKLASIQRAIGGIYGTKPVIAIDLDAKRIEIAESVKDKFAENCLRVGLPKPVDVIYLHAEFGAKENSAELNNELEAILRASTSVICNNLNFNEKSRALFEEVVQEDVDKDSPKGIVTSYPLVRSRSNTKIVCNASCGINAHSYLIKKELVVEMATWKDAKIYLTTIWNDESKLRDYKAFNLNDIQVNVPKGRRSSKTEVTATVADSKRGSLKRKASSTWFVLLLSLNGL